MLKRMKQNKKKGFTLVELIVVLVILAILAALLIPALTGYINKAREKQIIAETRQAVMAAQTLVDEAYTKKNASDQISIGATGDVKLTDIEELAELKTGTVKSGETYDPAVDTNKGKENKVSELVYTAHGKTCTYTEADEDQYKVDSAP